MTVAKPEISWILDITIAYPQGKPLDLPTIITGARPPCETVLFYRLFPSSVVSFDMKCSDLECSCILHPNIIFVGSSRTGTII